MRVAKIHPLYRALLLGGFGGWIVSELGISPTLALALVGVGMFTGVVAEFLFSLLNPKRRELKETELQVLHWSGAFDAHPEENENKSTEKAEIDRDVLTASTEAGETEAKDGTETLANLIFELPPEAALQTTVEEQIRLVERFSEHIQEGKVHLLIEKANGLSSLEHVRAFMVDTANRHLDLFFPVVLDEWMREVKNVEYAFFIMRRENPEQFAVPGPDKNPLGELIAQGYRPITASKANENDVVLYFRYLNKWIKTPDSEIGEFIEKQSNVIQPTSYGVIRKGRVTRLLDAGCIVSHELHAGGVAGERYMVLRKHFDSEAPTPAFRNVYDWVDTEHCVTRGHKGIREIFPNRNSVAFLFASGLLTFIGIYTFLETLRSIFALASKLFS